MKYFGTDGIRGEVGKNLTYDMAFRLGKSLSCLDNDTVVIGYDTRESKDLLCEAVAKGAKSIGMKVITVGVIPTPALIYYSYIKKITGVMITASHNPYYDNGLKIFKEGKKLSDAQELQIENLMDSCNTDSISDCPIEKVTDAFDLYYDLLSKNIVKSNLKIALDCANGATYNTAPYIFSKITSDLVVSGDTPNGTNINNGVGSTHIDNLKEIVIKNGCDLGFAFDGDGDRVLAVDKNGEVIDGDKLIFVITNYLKKRNKLNKNTVVFTKMSNLGMLKYLHDNNINTSIVDVGDKNVVKEIFSNDYSIGGESSGHIILPEILHTGDGVLNALFIVKILEEENKTLSELSNCFEMYPDKTINVKVINKETIMSNNVLLNRINEIKSELGNDSKVLVRASGTESLIRVSISCKNEQLLDKYLNELVNMIK